MAQGVLPTPEIIGSGSYTLSVADLAPGDIFVVTYQERELPIEVCLERALEINITSPQWAFCHETLKQVDTGA
jgi:hypothetical protein